MRVKGSVAVEAQPENIKDTEVGLLEQILIDTNPDITSGIFQAAFFFGLPSLALYLWWNRQSLMQGKRSGLCIAGSALSILLWVLLPVPLYLYSLELKYPKHVKLGGRGYFQLFINNAPTWASSFTNWLGRPAFAPPPIWLVLFVVAVGAVFLFVYNCRSPAKKGASHSAMTEKTKVHDAASVLESSPATADPTPPILTCSWLQLTWQKNGETWQPLCPRCSHVMGIVEKQPKGMFVKGAGLVAEAVCSIPGCNQFRKALSHRGHALQSRVQQEYDARSRQ